MVASPERILGGEVFHLKNHSAQDCGRYDYIADIQRIEKVRANDINFKFGYAIMLTNDYSYCKESTRKSTVDKAFRIHQGRVLRGSFNWSENAALGTKKGRPPFDLEGEYTIDWKEFSKYKNVTFMYNVVEVK